MDVIETIKMPVGASGHYNSQVCVGAFRPTVQDLFRTNSPHGLALNTAYFYGSLYDEDGGVYVYMRNIAAESLHVAYLFHKPQGNSAIVHPTGWKFYRGMGVNRLKGDNIRIHSWRGIPGPGFNMTISPDAYQVEEEGQMEISGTRVGLGMNAYFPQQGEDAYYSSVLFETSGTIFGKKVRGGMAWDQFYGPPGINWQTMRFFLEVHYAWVSGVNIYDNGDVENYHTVAGKGDWGFIFSSNKDEELLALSRSVEANIEMDEDRYPKRVLFRSPDAGEWEWVGMPDCHLNPKSWNLPLRWVEGPTRRVGDKRNLLYGGGYMEIYPSHF